LSGCGKNSTLGPLGPFLDIGTRGVWTGSIEQGVYRLTNEKDARAVRLLTLPRTDDPSFSASVDIEFGDTSEGTAGLALGHRPSVNQYYLLSLAPDGDVVLTRRAGSARKDVFRSAQTLRAGFNRLAFEGSTGAVDILLNGVKIGHIASPDISDGEAGIAARGLGRYGFANFVAHGYAPK
jgi:hypothetical protein